MTCSDDLRSGLIHGAEKLADDIQTGRYGDPHVMVTVLVHPDREPTVLVTLAGRPAYDLTHLVIPEDDSAKGGTPIPMAEILEAGSATTDAHNALRWWRKADGKPGDVVAKKIRSHWESRRSLGFERALSAAAERAARPEQCPYCKSRFTTRGIKMHLARARWCSQQEARAKTAEQAES